MFFKIIRNGEEVFVCDCRENRVCDLSGVKPLECNSRKYFDDGFEGYYICDKRGCLACH